MSRIYGIEPGLMIPEKVQVSSEADIFLTIYYLKNQVEDWEHKMLTTGVFYCKDLPAYRYSLDYLKQATKRFGVEMPEPEEGKRVPETESFKKWYNFFKNHFEGLSDEQWKTVVERRNNGEDFSEFCPTTSWQDATEMKMTPNNNQENQE